MILFMINMLLDQELHWVGHKKKFTFVILFGPAKLIYYANIIGS